jgi:flagellin
LQTGVKEGAQVSIDIASTSSKDLGLQGFAVQGQLTSGRVDTVVSDASDVLINGKNATTAATTADMTAKALATAINLNSGEHRTIASAYNTLKGVAPTQSTFAEGVLIVNTITIGAAGSVEELVSNINRDAGGVLAVLADDGTIELSNDTGDNIVIAGTTPSQAGFTAGTYTGFVTLNSMDNTDISVKAKSVANGYAGGAGATADVKGFGFNESVDGKSFTGTAVAANAITEDDDFRINGVQVGPSADSSAAAKVDAINAISAQTGVTASASTVAKLTYDFADIANGSDLTINGVLTDVSAETDIASVISVINAAKTGAVASLDTDGNLILSNNTGADISIENATSFVAGVTSQAGDAVTSGDGGDGTPFVLKGRISLTSETGADIRIESKTLDGAVSTTAANLIGFADQSGTSTLVGGAMSISTQDGAGRAITAIDNALDTVSENRANLGAFQNRLTAAVDNLSDQSRHLSESKSRIMDTDYAVETTNLARAQVIQQAATAMLAQANQQPSGVLALLQ